MIYGNPLRGGEKPMTRMNMLIAGKVNGSHTVAFYVKGRPVPKQSFRVAGRGHGYQSARVKAWQSDVGWTAQAAMRALGKTDPLVGELDVRLHFNLVNHRPQDLDNLSKGTLDACNRVVWQDDRQIVDLHITKSVDARNPGVEVHVSERKVNGGKD